MSYSYGVQINMEITMKIPGKTCPTQLFTLMLFMWKYAETAHLTRGQKKTWINLSEFPVAAAPKHEI